MDILGTIKGLVGGGSGGGAPDSGSLAAVTQLIQGTGGLGGLLEKFKGAGMADTVQSWIGLGANKSIKPEDVEKAVGGDTLDKIAKTAGIDKSTLMGKLAEYLPKVVDKLTPTGQVPPDGTVSQLLETLGKATGS